MLLKQHMIDGFAPFTTIHFLSKLLSRPFLKLLVLHVCELDAVFYVPINAELAIIYTGHYQGFFFPLQGSRFSKSR